MDVRFILGQFKLHQKKVQSWQIQGKIIGNSVLEIVFENLASQASFLKVIINYPALGELT